MKKKTASAAVETAVVFILVFLAAFYDVFYTFDSLLRDKLYQNPRGINNKIKVMKRNAYGFRDDRYFTLRLYALHDCRITRNVG